MTIDEIKDLLTPGSVWLRTDGAQVKVLFFTNQTLTPAQQEKYPPQVVYADADGRVLSREVDSFASLYTFLNIDPELEKRVENLIVFKAADYLTVDDPEDDDDIKIVDDEEAAEEKKPAVETKPEPVVVQPKAKPTVEVRQISQKPKIAASSPRALNVDFKLSDSADLATPALSAADLSYACKVYSRQPDEKYSMTVHRLSFELSETVTLESLKEVFHPSQTINTVDMFRVRTAGSQEIFVWDSWIGIYPEYSVSGLFGTVYVGTSEAPVDTAETPGIDAVNVSSSEPVQEVQGIPELPPYVDPYAHVEPLVLPATDGLLYNAPDAIALPEVANSTPAEMPSVVVESAPEEQPANPNVQPEVQPQVTTEQPVVQVVSDQ